MPKVTAAQTPVRPGLKSTKVGAQFARKLRQEFGDGALYSLSDPRIEAVLDVYRKDPEFKDVNRLIGDSLNAIGQGWGLADIGVYTKRSREGISQRLTVDPRTGAVEIQTLCLEREGRTTSFHEELLTRDAQGGVQRQHPPVVSVEKPLPDTVCQPVDQFYSKPHPEDSLPELVRTSYYRPHQEATRVQELVHQRQGAHAQRIQELVGQGRLTQAEGEARTQNFGRPVYNDQVKDKQLDRLEQEAFHLLHHPQNCGDGLYRTRDFYVSPGHLNLKAEQQGWEFQDDIPVADAVVIGAGPGGLSTALQLARRGARVVTFESETAGAAFSDAGAKPVHHLRTSGYLTNLVRDGFDYITGGNGLTYAELEHPASLLGRLEEYGNLAEAGRKGLEGLTGVEVHDIPEYPHGYGSTSEPALRGVLFAHLAKVAESVATDHPDSFLCERAPVNNVEYKDGFFTVETARGHRVKTRKLVTAAGLTGSRGEHARALPVLRNFAEAHPQCFENLSDGGKLPSREHGPMLLRERSLGNQAVRQSLADLPAGSRVAMVGSGESALKGALEILQLNQGLSVDLFVKGPVESAQVQIPPEYFFQGDSILATPDSDERARAEADRFGTPLTPRSLQLFFEHQQNGRARFLELGEYFNADSVRLSLTEDSKIAIEVISPEARARSTQEQSRFREAELLPAGESPVQAYDAVVEGIGYRPPPVEELDFLKEMGLPEEAREQVYVNTTGAPEHQMQTTIPGLAIKGRMIAEEIAATLPTERVSEPQPKQIPNVSALDYRSPEELAGVPYFLESGGLTEFGYNNLFRAVTQDGELEPDGIARLVLTEFDPALRRIYVKPDAERTPAERETLRRGLALAERMRGMKLPPVEDLSRLKAEGKLRETIEGSRGQSGS